MEALISSCELRPYKSFSTLERGEYPVKNFSISDTKYGKRIKVELKECYVYLPPRFSVDLLNEDVIKELNEQDIVMTFLGKGLEPNSRYVY